jgi:ABC-type glycerol-3-phosphate transport system permease component
MLLLIAGSIVGASAVAMVVVTHVDRSLKSQDLVTHGSAGGGILAAIYLGYMIAFYASRGRNAAVVWIFLGVYILPLLSTVAVTAALSQRILHRQREWSSFQTSISSH